MKSVFVMLLGMVSLTGSGAAAHDVRGLGHGSIPEARKVEFNRLEQIAMSVADPNARSVLVRLALWDPGTKLVACFFDGATDAEKAMVIQGARNLLDGQSVNLSFDFGTVPSYRRCADQQGPDGRWEDVRISFRHGCCHAYIGKTAHGMQAIAERASVAIQGVAQMAPRDGMRIVMHELLHVLGLHHEHQSPASVCKGEFNKEAILIAFRWSEADFETNIATLDRDTRRYKWSDYDEKSITRYYFNPALLHKGTGSPCYSGENFVPSPTDLDALRDAYPQAVSSEARERARSGAVTLQGLALPADLREMVDLATRPARQ
jgi:hypothetical protein